MDQWESQVFEIIIAHAFLNGMINHFTIKVDRDVIYGALKILKVFLTR